MKFLIIDGQFLTYKSLFSHQKLTATFRDKEIISGIPFGFIKAMIDMKIKFNPDFILVTWEGHPLIKKSIYPQYKEKREPLEIDIHTESEVTKAILKSLQIPNLFHKGYEGEDIANYIKRKLDGKNRFGYFYTNDSDAFAMIRNRFVLINNVDGEFLIMDKEELKKEKGLTPRQAKEIKILAGCRTDNVAGFKGIGNEFATYLIKKYGTARRVTKNINETESKYVRLNKLIRKDLKLLDTMTYITKILIPDEVQLARCSIKGKYTNLLAELECHTLLKGANKRILKAISKNQKKLKNKVIEELELET